MGAVRRSVPCFDIGQFRGIEGIVGHMHGFWAVTDEGTENVQTVFMPVGIFDGLMEGYHFCRAPPNQRADPSCGAFGVQ